MDWKCGALGSTFWGSVGNGVCDVSSHVSASWGVFWGFGAMSGIWCDTVFGRVAVCAVSVEFWIDPDDTGLYFVRGSVWAPDASGFAAEVRTARRHAQASAKVGDVAGEVLIDLGLGGQLDPSSFNSFKFDGGALLLRWNSSVPISPSAVLS